MNLNETNSSLHYLNNKKVYTVEKYNSAQIKSLITIEDLITEFISKDFNPFYLPYSSTEVTEFENLKDKILNDSFGNEYVAQSIKKKVFQTDEVLIQQFIKNQNLIHQLLTA